MPEQRRKFSPQFKAEAVQMVIETGKPIAEVARDLGVNDGTLGNWVKAWRDANPEPDVDAVPGRACPREGDGRRDPPAADGERVPEKSRGLLRPDAAVAERCAVIEAEKANYQITWMCAHAGRAALEFLRLAQPGRDADRGAAARSWASQVRRVFDGSRQTSGCRRVAAQLNREGHECSVGLVADLMRELGLRAVQPRAYKRTTVPGEDPVDSPDLIGRDFTGQRRPGSAWSVTSPTSRPARAGSTWPP